VTGIVQLHKMGLQRLKRRHTKLPEQQAHGAVELTSGNVLCCQLGTPLQPLLGGRNACRAAAGGQQQGGSSSRAAADTSVTHISHTHQSHTSVTHISHTHQSHTSVTHISHTHQSHTSVTHTHPAHWAVSSCPLSSPAVVPVAVHILLAAATGKLPSARAAQCS
jgi:hypothetical protein